MNGDRGEHWKQTLAQKKKKSHQDFTLEGLVLLPEFEGLTYKDLPKRQQNAIKNYDVRCAVIPGSWEMADYLEFFKRIQGGGTPMTDHELRRALTSGPFTELLDDLAVGKEVTAALQGAVLATDEVQQLLLRYFAMSADSPHKPGTASGMAERRRHCERKQRLDECLGAARYRCRRARKRRDACVFRKSSSLHCQDRFGKPAISQQGLAVMKDLNYKMGSWKSEGDVKRADLLRPLYAALDLATIIFPDNAFRTAVPLVKKGVVVEPPPNKVWKDSTKLDAGVWDAVLWALSRDEILKRKHDVIANKDAVRAAFVDVFQTHAAFTDSRRVGDTPKRTALLEIALDAAIKPGARDTAQITAQMRRELIAGARAKGAPCPLCFQALGPLDDHLHIDHIIPRAKGGATTLVNLQVVHKSCNLRKSDKVPLSR
mmetsp:Transcript_1459/g.5216  ORF Transcript_1459/g.5216 Transcript_1459/m.5216 type:complete len:429 (-) Transcript_1459:954-2240(-)